MGSVDLLPFVPQLQGQETEQGDWHCYREVLPTFLLCLALLNKVSWWSGGTSFREEELSRSSGPK